jgi:thioredoxin reductase
VIIVGAGPAGLSAALVLGRSRRRVLVIDAGRPRNAASHEMHGFLSRDCIDPAELRTIGREQLKRYPNVDFCRDTVTHACAGGDHFEVQLAEGASLRSRKLLFATGVVDELPTVEGMAELYGRSAFHCPYCDGWEVRDQPLAVYGQQDKGVGLAKTLLSWSNDIILCTDGSADFSSADRKSLKRLGIQVRSEKIARVVGDAGRLRAIVFDDGTELPRHAIFFNTGQHQHSELPSLLGCAVDKKESVFVTKSCETTVPGVYLAGDASRDVQLAIVAAAEGATAAFSINKALLEEDQKEPSRSA